MTCPLLWDTESDKRVNVQEPSLVTLGRAALDRSAR
jgi:hypothetical protein